MSVINGFAIILLLSLISYTSGMKVVWKTDKPADFDEGEAANDVEEVSRNGPCKSVAYGTDLECYPNKLFVAFAQDVVTSKTADAEQRFVAVFEKKSGQNYNYYEVEIGKMGGKTLPTQLFPNMEAVQRAFELDDSIIGRIKAIAENPKAASACLLICAAVTAGVEAWASSNA